MDARAPLQQAYNATRHAALPALDVYGTGAKHEGIQHSTCSITSPGLSPINYAHARGVSLPTCNVSLLVRKVAAPLCAVCDRRLSYWTERRGFAGVIAAYLPSAIWAIVKREAPEETRTPNMTAGRAAAALLLYGGRDRSSSDSAGRLSPAAASVALTRLLITTPTLPLSLQAYLPRGEQANMPAGYIYSIPRTTRR